VISAPLTEYFWNRSGGIFSLTSEQLLFYFFEEQRMSPEEIQPKPELSELDKPETGKTDSSRVEPPKPKPPRRSVPFKIMLINGLITLAELVLPLILTLVLLFLLARISDLGVYSSQLLAAMFMLFLVLIALILAFILTSLAGSVRGEPGMTGSERTVAFRWRFVKLIAGGLIIPIAAGVLTITQEFSPGVTYLSQGLRLAKTAVVVSPLVQVGDAVIKSKSSQAKLEGIRMLAGGRSAAALEQLLRILQEDKAALADPAVELALAKAVAAYNLEAKQQLIALFLKEADAAKSAPGALPDAYQAYFSADFDALLEEVRSQVTDPVLRVEQLGRLETLQVQLKSGLDALNLRLAAANPPGKTAYFCLETFVLMEVREDNDILNLAKKTAADSSYPDRLRVMAFQLVGKLGGDPEVNWLYPYLPGSSEAIRTAALSALADLQEKGKQAQSPSQRK
jgi:hypothetical protein